MEKKKISKSTLILILIIAILTTILVIKIIELNNLNKVIRDADIMIKDKDEAIQYYRELLDMQPDIENNV